MSETADAVPRRARLLLRVASADLAPEPLLGLVAEVAAEALPGCALSAWSTAGDRLRLVSSAGPVPLPVDRSVPDRLEVPRAEAHGTVVDRALRADDGTLLAVLSVAPPEDADAAAFLDELVATAGTALRRAVRTAAVERRNRHFVEAQRISHVGSYDFEIATNTNDWSDQLYRIYGREPQSFNASYERFLELVHPDDREKVVGVHQQALAQLSAYEMDERIVWPDGSVHTLASWGEVVPGPDGTPARMVGICWDVTEQRRADELSLLVHDAEVRRRHAVEINDNVVQGLASVVYLLELGRSGSALTAARATLATARAMAADLLGDSPEAALEGQLVRETASTGSLHEQVPAPRSEPGALRVLLADDAVDLRVLMRLTLASVAGVEVVGEAADGRQAVDAATELLPDVLLLDLSMPVMDGLQAIPLVREASPDTKILVLSGFEADRMRPAALAAGAHGYVEKGGALGDVVEAIGALFPGRVPAA